MSETDEVEILKKSGWLHLYQMDAVGSDRFIFPVIERGEGMHVYDTNGKKYIDAISGAYCVNVGYGRDRILQAAHAAAKNIHYVAPFSAANRFGIRLAQRLGELAQSVVGEDSRVFFVNSGSEAVETAMKIARAYARRTGKPDGYKIVGREGGYHGLTLGALSLCGFEALQTEYGPLVPGIHHASNTHCGACSLGLKRETCGLACAKSIASIIEREGADSVAAVLVEPFETSSGMIPPPAGYLDRVAEVCADARALLIVDEVITGFGRLGHWFGSERYGLHADIVVCAKGLTSGYESLGAVIVKREVADVFLGDDDRMFLHAATFGGRPGAAAAALETIAIIEEEDLLSNAKASGQYLRELLLREVQPLHCIGEIRSEGLLFGIDLVAPDGRPLSDAAAVERIQAALRRNGLIACLYYTRQQPVIELAPPLTVTRRQCEEIVGVLSESIRQAMAS